MLRWTWPNPLKTVASGQRFALGTGCVARGDIQNDKSLLTLLLTKTIYNAEAILKTYEFFMYGDIQYIQWRLLSVKHGCAAC
jgi:hypothetical protein